MGATGYTGDIGPIGYPGDTGDPAPAASGKCSTRKPLCFDDFAPEFRMHMLIFPDFFGFFVNSRALNQRIAPYDRQ